MVTFDITTPNNSVNFHVNGAFTVPRLNATNRVSNWNEFKMVWERRYGIELSDAPVNDIPLPVLIGADVTVAHEQLLIKRPAEINREPYAVLTPFGWTLFGKVDAAQASYRTININTISSPSDTIIHDAIQNFGNIESLGINVNKSELYKEETQALNMMKTSIKKVDGHFEVGLLWRSPGAKIPDNRKSALHRLYSLERRFKADPAMARRYQSVIEDHIRAGHAVKVKSSAFRVQGRTWFPPDHNVHNPNKPNKMRVVFDATAEYDRVSLNLIT